MTQHHLINHKKIYTLVYIYNYDGEQSETFSVKAKEVQEAYESLPFYRGQICRSHDLNSRLREVVEASGRLKLNLSLAKYRPETVQYVECAYHKDCWNCQRTLKKDYATYIALHLDEIEDQREEVRKTIRDTYDQEILFIFDGGGIIHKDGPLSAYFS
ncbi:MAG: hypothetical protein KA155_07430 [Alphaproteobacteria bacterium]|jgi:hypothetical protein|nr:hypothetical protein [Alphaproteobacteria bacterium]